MHATTRPPGRLRHWVRSSCCWPGPSTWRLRCYRLAGRSRIRQRAVVSVGWRSTRRAAGWRSGCLGLPRPGPSPKPCRARRGAPAGRRARRHAGRWPMSGRPVSRAERHPVVASSPVPEHPRHPQREQADYLHHPQRRRDGQSLHPQGTSDRDPRHPQGGDAAAAARGSCPTATEHGTDDAAPDVQQSTCAASGCARQRLCARVPAPGVLRPLARALLAVAAEVHAARRDLPDAGRRPSERALRMGNRGRVQGLHSGVRSVVMWCCVVRIRTCGRCGNGSSVCRPC